MCTCESMRPGIAVVPSASMTTSQPSTSAAGAVPTDANLPSSAMTVSPGMKGTRQSPETMAPILVMATRIDVRSSPPRSLGVMCVQRTIDRSFRGSESDGLPIRRQRRRDIVKAAVTLAAFGALGSPAARARAPAAPAVPAVGTFSHIDAVLRAATRAGQLPGVVALAATDSGVVYEGIFGGRRLNAAPAMTRDTVFRVASMVKLITSVAALQLMEQGKLSLDTPVPGIDPELASPQVLDGFDVAGMPQLRPAKRPISLRHLLTHTSGFTYRLWDAKAVQYAKAIELLPAEEKTHAPRTLLMFDPGERWQYGTSIDWVGRIVEHVSGEPLDAYFKKHIFDPLGMNDSGFVISPEQGTREALSHRRGPAGLLTPQPREHHFSQQSSQP